MAGSSSAASNRPSAGRYRRAGQQNRSGRTSNATSGDSEAYGSRRGGALVKSPIRQGGGRDHALATRNPRLWDYPRSVSVNRLRRAAVIPHSCRRSRPLPIGGSSGGLMLYAAGSTQRRPVAARTRAEPTLLTHGFGTLNNVGGVTAEGLPGCKLRESRSRASEDDQPRIYTASSHATTRCRETRTSRYASERDVTPRLTGGAGSGWSSGTVAIRVRSAIN